jgi:hypothetical protein
MQLDRSLFGLVVAAALSTTAHAQAVLGGGKTGSSFPITISQPGGYKLAGNLVVSDPATTAIVVNAANVTIDLNGFVVSGPNLCDLNTKTCTLKTPSAHGISMNVGTHSLTVRNGTVRGFSGIGISGGDSVRIESVTVAHNAAGGIALNAGAVLDRVIANYNGFYPYAARPAINIADGVVSNSTATYNLWHAFGGGHLIGVGATDNKGAAVFGDTRTVTVQQSRFGTNAGGHFLGYVQSLGGNYCGNAPC